jgi:hypothetical protein
VLLQDTASCVAPLDLNLFLDAPTSHTAWQRVLCFAVNDLIFCATLTHHRHVRFGSKADMCAATSHVCFTPNSDISSSRDARELWLMIVVMPRNGAIIHPKSAANKSLAGTDKTKHSRLI